MKGLPDSIQKVMKVALFVLGAVLASLVALDGPTASASHTQILINTAYPDPLNPGQTVCTSSAVGRTVNLMSGGNSKDLCVWAVNVDDPQGAAGFEVGVRYDSALVNVTSMTGFTIWLGSTGRSASCTPAGIQPDFRPGVGRAFVSCNTAYAPPPFGPKCPNQCTGALAKLTVQPKPGLGNMTLDLANDSFLVDTGKVNGGTVVEPSRILNSVLSVQVIVAPCADYNEDNTVRSGDILYIVQRYRSTTNPEADLDGSGLILSPDILIAVSQYRQDCPVA